MADYIVTSGELTTVANAIREKNGTSSNLSWPDGFVSGISSGSGGGGGETWETVFEDSVTTVEILNTYRAEIQNLTLTADKIKVTFNGTEYICERKVDEYDEAYYGADGSTEGWSEYPFEIYSLNGVTSVVTETAGTYTLKIEEPQSSGESDFSTAEVVITNNRNNDISVITMIEIINEYMAANTALTVGTHNITAVLYKNTARWIVGTGTVNVTGNATVETTPVGTGVIITGDCTITIS